MSFAAQVPNALIVAAAGDHASMSFSHPWAAARVGIVVAGELGALASRPTKPREMMTSMRATFAAFFLALIAACDVPPNPDPTPEPIESTGAMGGSTEGDSGSTTSGAIGTSASTVSTSAEESSGTDAVTSSTGEASTGVCEYGAKCEDEGDCEPSQVCGRVLVVGGAEFKLCLAPCTAAKTCHTVLQYGCSLDSVACAPDADGLLLCLPKG